MPSINAYVVKFAESAPQHNLLAVKVRKRSLIVRPFANYDDDRHGVNGNIEWTSTALLDARATQTSTHTNIHTYLPCAMTALRARSVVWVLCSTSSMRRSLIGSFPVDPYQLLHSMSLHAAWTLPVAWKSAYNHHTSTSDNNSAPMRSASPSERSLTRWAMLSLRMSTLAVRVWNACTRTMSYV